MNEIMAPALSHTGLRKWQPNQRFITVERIKKIVTEYFGFSMRTLSKPCRKTEVVHCRQVMMFFLSHYTKLSLKSIGGMFGGRDHTTVVHSRQTIKDLMDSDDRVFYEIEELTEKLLQMNIKITSEATLVDVATEGIHLLNNLRAATRLYDEHPGNDARQSKRRWEDKCDAFLSKISSKESKPILESVKIMLP